MDERDFELINALDISRNITKAADMLFVTQSALSKRIFAIEEELGITILERSRLGIHFTPAGEEVLTHTRKAAEELRCMREDLDASKGYICGTLNAGVSINYSLYRLPDVLVRYRKAYPHVDTHITTNQSRKLYLQLLNGELDVAIIRGDYPWKWKKLLISREPICAICSAEDAGRQLSTLPYIGRKTDSAFEQDLNQWMRENNLQSGKKGIYVDNITTCVEMVSRGLGWAVVPEICLAGFKGSATPLRFSNGEPFERSTYIMYSDTVSKLPQVNAFINTVRDCSEA